MMDPAHPADALFFVAEGDFRIYAADCVVERAQLETEAAAERASRMAAQIDADLHERRQVQSGEPSSLEEAVATEAMAAAAELDPSVAHAVKGVAAQVRSEYDISAGPLEVFAPAQRWSVKEGRPMPPPSPELEDLVCICNQAARLGRGNFVWLGWNASPDRTWECHNPERIANGSQLVAVTAAGARWLQPKLEA